MEYLKICKLLLQKTFDYNSNFWINNKTYKITHGLEGLTKKETKLASFWNTSFKKICLGMTINGATKWVVIDYQASSLFDVMADETYKETNVTSAKWKSLIASSQLYQHCNKEGLNIHEPATSQRKTRLRIGLITNSNQSCAIERFNSCIGFGTLIQGCLGGRKNTACGNLLACKTYQTEIPAFGYILVQENRMHIRFRPLINHRTDW